MLHIVVAPLAALLISGNTNAADTIPVPAAPVFGGVVPTIPLTVSPGTLRDSSAARVGQAVEYSDLYYTRLTIHRYASYAMLPIFGAEYYLGQRLMNGPYAGWVKPTHVGVAAALGGLFAINTVTGVWNLWDARKDPNARTLRYVHAALLLAADAGFALAPALVDDDNLSGLRDARTLHRNVAIGSMSLATLGTAIMWFRKE